MRANILMTKMSFMHVSFFAVGLSAAAPAGTAHMGEGAKSGLHHKGAKKKPAGWWAMLTGQSQTSQSMEEVGLAQVCSSS